jgi:hypothetical protein
MLFLDNIPFQSGVHHPEVVARVQINDEEHLLDLQLNEDLLPQGHVLWYQENGITVGHQPRKEVSH